MIDKTCPLVSIAIPTYNRADSYLKYSLQSALDQTYPNIEIIVSDNCSTDNTEEVVKNYNDSRIRYFRQNTNIGMVNNVDFCLGKVKGDCFLLLNDDDMIDNDFVTMCMKAVNYNTDFGVILTGTRVINEDGVVLREDTNKAGGLSTTDFFLAWFEHKVPLYLCSTLYNTKHFKEIGGLKSVTYTYDDDVALVQLAAKFGRVDVHDVKASFRRHSENIGDTTKIIDWCEDSHYLLDVMCNLVPGDEALIRNRGMVYFCKENYVRSNRIKSRIRRFYAYLIVYKKFNYCQAPFHFIYTRNILYKNARRLMSAVKKRMRQVLNREVR